MNIMKLLLDLFIENWIFIAPVLYEIIARIWPSKINISVLDAIWKVINVLIPNRRQPDGNEKEVTTDKSGQLVNKVKVRVGRHIVRTLLILTISLSACGQTWQNFKGIRLVNNSDTTAQLAVQGSLFFDDQVDSLYLYDGTKWINLSRGAFAKPGAFWPLAGNATLLDNVFIDTDAFSAFIGRSELGMGVDATSAFMANDVGDAVSIFHSGGLEILGSGNIDISTNNGDIQIAASNDITIAASNNITLNTFGTTRIGDGPIELIGLGSASPSDHVVMIGSDNILTRSNISLSSGTYTPTVTLSTNVSSATVTSALYTRIGDIVTVTLEIQGSFNGTGVGMLFFTIPFTTVNSLVQNAGVVSGERSDTTDLVGIVGLNNGTRAAVTFNGDALNGTSFDVGVVFTYIVQ
jgi:hypothetical protein